MALVYCPNCRSANSSCQCRCWICQKALAPPPANPTGRPLTYPQKMRLVRFEETINDPESEVSCRVVYVKSVEDDRPVRDYWQTLRDQQLLKLRRIYAGAAAGLSLALAATLFVLSTPAPAQSPIKEAPRYMTMVAPDNPLAHTILPPPNLTANYPEYSSVPYQPFATPAYYPVKPTRFQPM